MKRIFIIYAALASLLFVSCKKENQNDGNNHQFNSTTEIMQNIAGAYSIQHNIQQNPFGYSANFDMEDLTVSRDSMLFIDRISENQIKTYGFFNSTGTVINDRIEFDSISIISSVFHSAVGTSTELNVVAKFENAYYSNGVINLKLRVPCYRIEDNSLYQDYAYNVIAIKQSLN